MKCLFTAFVQINIKHIINYLFNFVFSYQNRQKSQLQIRFCCWLSFFTITGINAERILTNYELASMTLGAQWIVSTPSYVYLNQTGDCAECSAEHFRHWSA